MKLSIIIVSYNTAELTLAAAKAAWTDATNSKLLKNATELYIVDNNSSDNSVELLKKFAEQSPHINVLPQKENLGFARANNLAIEQSKGEYILLLNSDTLVHSQSLETLVTDMEQTEIDEATATLSSYHGHLDRLGILAATLVNQDGSLQPQGGAFPTLLSLTSHMLLLDDLPLIGRFFPSTQHTGHNQHQTGTEQEIIQSDWVGGTAMLIRRQVIDEIGNLDGAIFMYGEDVEYCLRAAHHHWDVGISPQAKVTHLGSASAGSARAILGELKGYIYIWSKHKPDWQIPIAKQLVKLGCRVRIALFNLLPQYKSRVTLYQQALQELHNV